MKTAKENKEEIKKFIRDNNRPPNKKSLDKEESMLANKYYSYVMPTSAVYDANFNKDIFKILKTLQVL